MSVTITITNAGRAAMVNAQHTGTASVAIAAIGLSATSVTPDPAATSLPGEFKRVNTVAGQMVSADVIHVTMTDSTADAYSANAFAIYLADGTLFAIYGQASAILTKTAETLGLLAVDIQLADSSAATISFGDTSFLNPPASETVQGVVELATVAEAQAGIDALRALTPAGARAAVLGYLLAQDGAGSGLDADLLDGQHGSYYADIPSRLGYTPVQQGGGAGQGTNRLFLGWGTNARLKAQVDSTDMGNIITDAVANGAQIPFNGTTMRRNGNGLWGPDNDGAGSGLDADLLDGQDSAYYVNIPARLGYTPAVGNGLLGDIDLNAATTSGMFRVNIPSNGPPGNIYYGQLLVMRSQDTITQIYSSYADGTLWTRSGAPGSIGGTGSWSAWSALVKASSATTYSAADVLGKLMTVDGSGSGLDADLLDGLDSSAFAKLSGANFSGNISAAAVSAVSGVNGQVTLWANSASNTGYVGFHDGSGNRKGYIGFQQTNGGTTGAINYHNDAGTGHLFDSGVLNSMGGLQSAGNQVWHAGNDGSGSGLDADLFDGLDSSAFTKFADFVGSLGDSGWQPLPGGLILQWGTTVISDGANTLQTVNLPRAYPNKQFGVVGSSASVNSTGGAIVPPGGSNNQIQVFANNNGAAIFWISLGK